MKYFFEHTKELLAWFWSFMSAVFIAFILYRFGSEKEILTLIIGLVSGTILGSILGTYFTAENRHSKNTQKNQEVEHDN